LVIESGDVADLVILNSDPFTADVGELRTMQVAGTMLRGGWTHRSGL
jgi:predicted amidohydrolase YtcJ